MWSSSIFSAKKWYSSGKNNFTKWQIYFSWLWYYKSYCPVNTINAPKWIVKLKIRKIKIIFYLISDENDKIWYWDYKFYYDIGEEVKLRIYDIKYKTFNENNKNINKNLGANYNSSNFKNNYPITNNLNSNINKMSIDINSDFNNKNEKFCFENFMEVLGSFNQEGLGPNKWWQ